MRCGGVAAAALSTPSRERSLAVWVPTGLKQEVARGQHIGVGYC